MNHTTIDSIYGTMDDFDQLIQGTKNNNMSVIMDFIPNHTGKESVWFQKSQRREGKYADYYIWAPCDPVNGTYINNWMSVKGGRAWTYDKIRKECYLHQLERDKPDLNLRNSDVRQELENILRFWLNKGVDGFHVQNVQHLYEDQDLRNETLIPGKTGNAYDDFDHTQTRNHPENAKLLQSWKHVLDTFIPKTCRERALVVTTGNDIDAAMKYLDAGVNIVRVNLMSGNGTSLAEHIETILNQLDDDAACKRIGWMYSDKDSSRLASKVGPENVKAFLTIQATVPGIPFNYYGNEIGMTDHPTHSGRWKYRTPMQWDRNGTGFSQNPPWLTQNPNHKTVNVESELSSKDNFTTLKVNRRLQELRRRESFQWGETKVFREGDLVMYTRKAKGFPGYLMAVNLGKDEVTIESLLAATGIPKEVKVVFHTHQTIQDTDISRSMENSYMLGPSQGVILEYP
uniref:Neutral and basic amino acid transport protein rBAT n=1 Tax=Magallana gigas TaxID=29159 RepID=K1QQH0_MAGGI